jgi:hypothetical protein
MPFDQAGVKVVLSGRHDVQAVLEHTWLKRRLLAQVRENSTLWATDLDLPLPGVLRGLEGRLIVARKFIDALTDLYGPAQLVDEGPLRNLPSGVRHLIRSAVHRAYLRSDS